MNTLIIALDDAISEPLPDTPLIPDTDGALRWSFDATSLNGADGSDVVEWVAGGAAPLLERKLSNKPAGWSWPKLSLTTGPGGRQCVEFDGSAQLRMQAEAEVIEQPITFAGVIRVDSYAGSVFTRIWGGNPSGVISVAPVGGNLRLQAGQNANTGIAPGGWFAVVVVFDGPRSFIALRDHISGWLSPGTGYYNGGGLGGSTSASALPGSGLMGAVHSWRCYGRALSGGDAAALINQMSHDVLE